jgi:Dolichyl-phosphate-mannose-protein mannosyltransferase
MHAKLDLETETSSRSKMSSEKKLILTNLEYVVPALGTVSLIISCVVFSAKKYFVNDELLSYYLLSDKSFLHMLSAFHDKINAAPPLYFLLGWIWARVFGASELSLRLFSCLGMSAALWLLWVTLRRTYRFWPTSIGALSVFCTSGIVLYQNSEARWYGLFIAFCAVGLLLYDTACRKSEVSRCLLIGTVCTHAAIVNTHLFGLIYSAALLLALILRDRCLKAARVQLYLSIALSWFSLIPYIPSFLNQSAAASLRTWLPKPVLGDLVQFMTLSSPSLLSGDSLQTLVNLFALVLLVITSGAQFLLCQTEGRNGYENREEGQPRHDSEAALLIVAYAFLTVPVFIWVLSQGPKPIFCDRYMLPTALSWSILLAYVASRLLYQRLPTFKKGKSLSYHFRMAAVRSIFLIPLILLLLAQPVVLAVGSRQESLPGLHHDKAGYNDLPIVIQHSHVFLRCLHYSPARGRYFFILDWEAAADEASGLFGPQEFKNLEALARNYPDLQKHIVSGEEFLRKHDRFLVLGSVESNSKVCSCDIKGGLHTKWEDLSCPQWLRLRVLADPHYRIQPLGKAMLLVNRL